MTNTIRLAAPLQTESLVDGKGVRMAIWNQGCKLKCPGCHNPETHDCRAGQECSLEILKQEIKQNAYRHNGITLTGGDPFLQPEANQKLAQFAHSINLNVWAYCGNTFDILKNNKETYQLLKECDVLVDGPFILTERDLTLPFRGSRNQRIIDVQKSLQTNSIILYIK